jgi:hypothetical protein
MLYRSFSLRRMLIVVRVQTRSPCPSFSNWRRQICRGTSGDLLATIKVIGNFQGHKPTSGRMSHASPNTVKRAHQAEVRDADATSEWTPNTVAFRRSGQHSLFRTTCTRARQGSAIRKRFRCTVVFT